MHRERFSLADAALKVPRRDRRENVLEFLCTRGTFYVQTLSVGSRSTFTKRRMWCDNARWCVSICEKRL